MMRLHLITLFAWIICHLVISVHSTYRENKRYNQTSDPIINNQIGLKNVIPIVIEGQPPLTELSSSGSATSATMTTEISDKLTKTVSQKGLYINSTEKTVAITFNSTNVTMLPNSAKILNRFHIAPVSERTIIGEENNSNLSSPESRKNIKPKPAVTIGEKEVDKPIPASPTSKSSFDSPRKIDYIVPGVITVTTLPLLAIIFYVLYKRGRDYWDKRHYRRMDFLIDGMYNE